MLFEDILLLLGLGAGVFFIGIPLYKIVRIILPQKRDPVKEAKQRVEVARADAEAAKLNKEAEKIYEELYSDVLDDNKTTNENRRKL